MACGLVGSGAHPDLTRLEPEELGKPIRVEQIRDLTAALGLRAALGSRRVAVLEPADAMNRYAANALLKTLEEPPGDAVLLLVSHAPTRLAVTVRSRCQRLVFRAPPPEEGERWLAARLEEAGRDALQASRLLALAAGAPFDALAIDRDGRLATYARVREDARGLLARADPIEVAVRWKTYGLAEVCRWSYRVSSELVAGSYAPTPTSPAVPPGGGGGGEVLGGEAIRRLFRVMDLAIEGLRALEQGVTLNEQLAVDRLALGWAELGAALEGRGPAAPGATLERER
jgi:DNA polymerase-3 subunit delta'